MKKIFVVFSVLLSTLLFATPVLANRDPGFYIDGNVYETEAQGEGSKGGTWKWDGESSLDLNNFQSEHEISNEATDQLNITVTGNNSAGVIYDWGGSLNITGGGSLEATTIQASKVSITDTSVEIKNDEYTSTGIYGDKGVDINNSNVTINAEAKNFIDENSDTTSGYGIVSDGDVNIKNSNVDIKVSETVEDAKKDNDANMTGIAGNNVTIDNSNVKVKLDVPGTPITTINNEYTEDTTDGKINLKNSTIKTKDAAIIDLTNNTETDPTVVDMNVGIKEQFIGKGNEGAFIVNRNTSNIPSDRYLSELEITANDQSKVTSNTHTTEKPKSDELPFTDQEYAQYLELYQRIENDKFKDEQRNKELQNAFAYGNWNIISAFLKKKDASGYFTAFSTPASDFVQGLNFIDNLQISVFKFDDIAQYFGCGEDYEKALIKEKIFLAIGEIGESLYTYEGSSGQALLKRCKNFLSTTKDVAGLDSIKEEFSDSEAFELFYSSVKDLKKVVDYGEYGLEYAAIILSDYQRGIDIIDSFRRNYQGGDRLILESINEAEELYKDNFYAWTTETLLKVTRKEIYGLAKKLMTDTVPLLKAVDLSVKYIGKITGAKKIADAKMDAMIYKVLDTACTGAYQSAIERVQGIDGDDSNYITYARDAANCFELKKIVLESMFQSMSKASSGTKKQYYGMIESVARGLSMNDKKNPVIETYQEYLKY